MKWQQMTLLTIAMAMASTAAPQAQQQQSSAQQQQQPVASASNQIAQSREAPAYPDSGYSTGFGAGGGAGYAGGAATSSAYGAPAAGGYGGVPAAAASSAYGAPQAAAGGNTGYYYYYYPVQEQKEAASYHPQKENYVASDSYGIDPLGIIAVLAVAGLVIAGLALLFPGWAYVRSDENVYYRALQAAPSLMSMSKEDFRIVTSLVLAAVEGEDCIDKIMCDASKLVKKVKKADSWLKVMEEMAPTSVSSTIKKLRSAMKKGDECKKTVSCPAKTKKTL